jgi:O-antigen ligase
MSPTLLNILGIMNFIVFLGLMLFSRKDKNLLYLKFIVISFPLMHTRVIPSITSFDLISVLFFFLFYKPKPTGIDLMRFFRYILFLLALVIITGLIFSPVVVDKENFLEIITTFPIFIFVRILVEECNHDIYFFDEIIKLCRYGLMFSLFFLGIQMVMGLNFSLAYSLNPNVYIYNGIRYPGFFSDPQQFSQYLGAFSFVCLIKTSDEEKISKTSFFVFILAIVAILAAGGRAGLMGWGIGLAIYLLFSEGKYKVYMISALLAIAAVAFLFQDKLSIFNRGTDLNETYDFRATIWRDAIGIFVDHPFWGIGISNYGKYVFIHNPDQIWMSNNEYFSFDQPESGYLKILTELGGVGFLLLMIMILIPVMQNIVRFLQKKDTISLLLLSGLVCWIVGFYSTYSLGDIRIKILVGLLLGLMIFRANSPNLENSELTDEIESEPNQTVS